VAARFGTTLDLRVAQIVKVERHPKADKLYIETLDIAGEERIIVSGLVPHFREDELLNRRIIVAYNLKPAKLRGVESRGMLLAASLKREDGSELVELLDPGDAPTGSRVTLEGLGEDSLKAPEEITIDDFFTVPIEVLNHRVLSGGRALTVNGGVLLTKLVADGGVR
jgi:methionyl-tRNA synthetase